MKRIYLDYAASTPVDARVRTAMEPYWKDVFANPFSVHQEGRVAHEAIVGARKRVALLLGCKESQVVFTSGATEANALAMRGYLDRLEQEEALPETVSIAISSIEHASVLDEALREMIARKGVTVERIPVTSEGLIDMKAADTIFARKPVFVSVGYANSEIGTIQPIHNLARIYRKRNPSGVLHVDASQAPLWCDVRTIVSDVDLLTLDSQKMYGPKGVGVLFVRDASRLASLFGGAKALRPGTPNVPGIVGCVKALELANEEREKNSARVQELRDYCIDAILAGVSGAILNGSREERLPNNVNVSFPGHESEFLAVQLDVLGIACSTRSACLSEGNEGSYVVAALDPENADRARSALRFSFGKDTTRDDIDYLVATLKNVLS